MEWWIREQAFKIGNSLPCIFSDIQILLIWKEDTWTSTHNLDAGVTLVGRGVLGCPEKTWEVACSLDLGSEWLHC